MNRITNEEVPLEYEEFLFLHKTMAKVAYQRIEKDRVTWLLMVQNFVEYFHLLKVRTLSFEELKQFGYIQDIKDTLNHIKVGDVAESLIYVGANLNLVDPEDALMFDAYNFAVELFEKHCKDENVKKEVVGIFKGSVYGLGQKILDSVPDEVQDKRLTAIASSYSSFSKDEKKYIKKSLVGKGLDESVVIDLKLLHENYAQIMNEKEGE